MSPLRSCLRHCTATALCGQHSTFALCVSAAFVPETLPFPAGRHNRVKAEKMGHDKRITRRQVTVFPGPFTAFRRLSLSFLVLSLHFAVFHCLSLSLHWLSLSFPCPFTAFQRLFTAFHSPCTAFPHLPPAFYRPSTGLSPPSTAVSLTFNRSTTQAETTAYAAYCTAKRRLVGVRRWALQWPLSVGASIAFFSEAVPLSVGASTASFSEAVPFSSRRSAGPAAAPWDDDQEDDLAAHGERARTAVHAANVDCPSNRTARITSDLR